MNINHLRMFIKIVEQGSISKVAGLMNISQSALSQQLRTMEQEFGANLFERNTHGVIPTNIGIIVYNRAFEIVSAYDKIFTDIADVQNQNKSLHIIATPSAYSYALPCTFYHVKHNYPDYSLSVEAMSSSVIEDKIAKGQGDMGIIVGKPGDKTLSYKKVFSDSVFLVCGESIKISSSISCQELYRHPVIMLVNTQKTRQLLDRELLKNGIDVEKLHIPYTLESTESIKLSAVNGYGLAFLPYMAIKKELYHKQLRIIDCACLQLKNDFYSIKRNDGNYLNTELSKLTSYIEKILKETIC